MPKVMEATEDRTEHFIGEKTVPKVRPAEAAPACGTVTPFLDDQRIRPKLRVS